MKKWFLFFTLFFVMVNISIPSALKGANFFSETTTEQTPESENETERVEEIEKELFFTSYSPLFSVSISHFHVTYPLTVFISTYLLKIFVPPSL